MTSPTVTATDPGAPAGPVRAWWSQQNANPISRAQAGIAVALLALTAGAWVYLLRGGPDHDHALAGTPTMGMGVPLFLAVWVAMMIASMFPAVSPMVLIYARVSANRRGNGRTWTPTSLFVSGYLLLWTAFGVGAYAAAWVGEALAGGIDAVHDNAPRIGAALIVVAGGYQFSGLKERCLTECRSPLAFLAEHWRPGRLGAVTMGLRHGLHCAGCCWALMAVLFPLGMTNIAALAGVTALTYAEKVLPGARSVRFAAGVGLIAFGLCAFVDPGLLPGAHQLGHHMSG
jgi:predicted metal-binding membrane protein